MQAISSVLLREPHLNGLPRELLTCIAEYATEEPSICLNGEPRYIYKNITYVFSRFDKDGYRLNMCRVMHGRNLRFTAYRRLLMTYDMDADQLLSITTLPSLAWQIHGHNKNIAIECEDDTLVYTYYVDYRFNFRQISAVQFNKRISGIYNQYHIVQTARDELRFYEKNSARYMMYLPGPVIIYSIQKNIMTFCASSRIYQTDISKNLIKL